MTFSRTPSGIANYGRFFNSDVMVFSEGKVVDEDGGLLPDQLFYLAVFKSINPNWRVKIKCVGNRDSALSYVDVIRASRAKNCVVAIDKDRFGISASFLNCPEVIVTHGYSWENDLCTYRLVLDVIKDITAANKAAANWFSSSFWNFQKRLAFLSALDVSSQVCGGSLLPKNGGRCGVGFQKKGRFVIPVKEIRRLSAKYRQFVGDCSVAKEVKYAAFRTIPQQCIQGHLWEHAIRFMISTAASVGTKMAQPPALLLLNLMLSKFNTDPAFYLGAVPFRHYRDQIRRRIN